jgi:hypothetical protein
VTPSIKIGLDALCRAWRAVCVSVRAGRDIPRRMPPCAGPRYKHLWPDQQAGGFAVRYEVPGAPFDEPWGEP